MMTRKNDAMKLASDEDEEEDEDEDADVRDTEPILSRATATYRDDGASSSSEAGMFSGDIALVHTGLKFTGSRDGDTDSVNMDQPQCRICLDTGGDDLIAPCRCRGTQKFVHRSCLDNWRAAKVVALLGMLVYKFYGEELREMFGYEQHPYGFYLLAVLAVLLVGLLYGFFIAIICGQKISDRHYHVLAKQELTKEYVVESRNENEEPPELDSGHITELRMLGLY